MAASVIIRCVRTISDLFHRQILTTNLWNHLIKLLMLTLIFLIMHQVRKFLLQFTVVVLSTQHQCCDPFISDWTDVESELNGLVRTSSAQPRVASTTFSVRNMKCDVSGWSADSWALRSCDRKCDPVWEQNRSLDCVLKDDSSVTFTVSRYHCRCYEQVRDRQGGLMISSNKMWL